MENIVAVVIGLLIVALAGLWAVSPLFILGYVGLKFKRIRKEFDEIQKALKCHEERLEKIADVELLVHEQTIPEAPRAFV